MSTYTDGISALERELTEIDRRRPLIERALIGLRELAGVAVPKTKKGAAKSGRTDGRTDGARVAPTRRAEPP